MNRLSGYGPWGVEAVSRATGVAVRTLHDWHKRGVARASAVEGARDRLRYQRADVERVCRIAGARKANVTLKCAVKAVEAGDGLVAGAFHAEPRPEVTFRGRPEEVAVVRNA